MNYTFHIYGEKNGDVVRAVTTGPDLFSALSALRLSEPDHPLWERPVMLIIKEVE
jgi:hypothetical protein